MDLKIYNFKVSFIIQLLMLDQNYINNALFFIQMELS